MTLIKINPEDLVVGQKYLVEMEYTDNITGTKNALEFNHNYYFPPNQPIYTLEKSSDTDNVRVDGKPMQSSTDLEMLVNVASRLCSSLTAFDFPNNRYAPDMNLYAAKALELITACKNALKEGER